MNVIPSLTQVKIYKPACESIKDERCWEPDCVNLTLSCVSNSYAHFLLKFHKKDAGFFITLLITNQLYNLECSNSSGTCVSVVYRTAGELIELDAKCFLQLEMHVFLLLPMYVSNWESFTHPAQGNQTQVVQQLNRVYVLLAIILATKWRRANIVQRHTGYKNTIFMNNWVTARSHRNHECWIHNRLYLDSRNMGFCINASQGRMVS